MTIRQCKWRECRRTMVTQRADAEFCQSECKDAWHNEERRKRRAPATRVIGGSEGERQPLRAVRGQQEEGQASADYLILAREQIARTLLHTGWFTADDLEPLGIPQQYRRSVHGSATGFFSGEQPYMEEAGRRKSERPERKGAKNTVFRITVKGRRELPVLLKGMAGPVRDATKRLYGEVAGVGGGRLALEAPSCATPHPGDTPDQVDVSDEALTASLPAEVDQDDASPAASPALVPAAGEPRPTHEPLSLIPDAEAA